MGARERKLRAENDALRREVEALRRARDFWQRAAELNPDSEVPAPPDHELRRERFFEAEHNLEHQLHQPR